MVQSLKLSDKWFEMNIIGKKIRAKGPFCTISGTATGAKKGINNGQNLAKSRSSRKNILKYIAICK